MKPLPKQWLIGIAVVVILGVTVLINRTNAPDDAAVDATPTPSVSSAPAAVKPKPTKTPSTPETTSASGTYKCALGKTFTLSVRSDGTARVTGSDSSSGLVLKKTSAGIWTSDNGKVTVREIAGYTILVENNATTRDVCYLK